VKKLLGLATTIYLTEEIWTRRKVENTTLSSEK